LLNFYFLSYTLAERPRTRNSAIKDKYIDANCQVFKRSRFARAAALDSDRLSFIGCFQILECHLSECDANTNRSLTDWYVMLLWEMSQERIEPRRNRINSRVIKQKIAKWPKKRSQHRHPPPLAKTFAATVVMIR